MKCFFGFELIPADLEPSILTWGVFDGLHLGHQQVLAQVVSWAQSLGLSSLVLTFRRHPREVVTGAGPPLVTSLEHRLLLIERLHLDAVVVADFDRQFADMSAAEFVAGVLHGKLKGRGVVRGAPTRFGRGGEGDLALLRRLGQELSFEVRVVPACQVDGKAVSSTALRKAIAAGDLESVGRLLGRPLTTFGTVVRGGGRGRQLGFPSATLDLGESLMPGSGVYVCRARVGGTWRPALASIGTRPTFHPEADRVALEVHILDFERNLHGEKLEIEFLKRLRAQIRFASDRTLVAQIKKDVLAAREFFRLQPS